MLSFDSLAAILAQSQRMQSAQTEAKWPAENVLQVAVLMKQSRFADFSERQVFPAANISSGLAFFFADHSRSLQDWMPFDILLHKVCDEHCLLLNLPECISMRLLQSRSASLHTAIANCRLQTHLQSHHHKDPKASAILRQPATSPAS